MSDNGENHVDGVCDNCGGRGRLGWVVGLRDKTHRHACRKRECLEALERADVGE